MRCVDVNVLVYAHRPESPGHDGYRAWLDVARSGHEPLGLSDVVLSGFLRVVTHARVFREPSPLGVALEFVDGLLGSPATSVVAPGERHWSIFADLCRTVGATGNVIPDAYLAALALEQGATWVTADRSFGRFPGLRREHPLDG
jgi:toxin-antitoxin system PIN domain toxin